MTLPTHVQGVLPSLEISNGSATLKLAELEILLAGYLASVPVDETWYLSYYPDIRQAQSDGSLGMTPTEHYRRRGYLEGRLPYAPAVDDEAYRAKYADVNEGIVQGIVPSAQQHFISHGYRERRDPQPKGQAGPVVHELPKDSKPAAPTFRRSAL
jgi:hypothetical protein